MDKKCFYLHRSDLHALFDVLEGSGYHIMGPTVRDGAIVLDRIYQVDDLPVGWQEEQEAGHYRLVRRKDAALFGFNNGPHSWKKFLFPPTEKLYDVVSIGRKFTVTSEPDCAISYAFLGVRACDLAAIEVQDVVFINGRFKDSNYEKRRSKALIIAVNCGQAAPTCFCTSMNSGPRVSAGFDISLTEIIENDDHFFLFEEGSERGAAILAQLPKREAAEQEIESGVQCTKRAEAQIIRKLPSKDVKDLLYRNYENSHWDDIAQRCLSCANCTMVCPTCFCSKVEDVTDLSGSHAERWREWDSCFTSDFSYIHGGSIRQSTKSRYRQWLTHKLATWVDQFGSSGCVGCGRCVTWCPVAIDFTKEIMAFEEKDLEKRNGTDTDD